jgi:hypothetical protein
MKRFALSLSLTLLAALTPACIADPDDGGATTDAGATGGTEVPVDGAALSLTFVSGHLGNYWDCPGEANGAGAAGACSGNPDRGREVGVGRAQGANRANTWKYCKVEQRRDRPADTKRATGVVTKTRS